METEFRKKRDAQIGTAFLQVRLCMYTDGLSVHSNIGRQVLLASFVVSLVVKNPPAKARDTGNAGSIPVSGRTSDVGSGSSFHYSCLEYSGTGEPGGLQSMQPQRVEHN